MGLDHGIKVKIHHQIRVRDDHIFFLLIPEILQDAGQCPHPARIRLGRFLGKRRENA